MPGYPSQLAVGANLPKYTQTQIPVCISSAQLPTLAVLAPSSLNYFDLPATPSLYALSLKPQGGCKETTESSVAPLKPFLSPFPERLPSLSSRPHPHRPGLWIEGRYFLTHSCTRLWFMPSARPSSASQAVFVFVCGAGGWTPGLAHTGNTFPLCHPPSPVILYDPFADHSFLVTEDFDT